MGYGSDKTREFTLDLTGHTSATGAGVHGAGATGAVLYAAANATVAKAALSLAYADISGLGNAAQTNSTFYTPASHALETGVGVHGAGATGAVLYAAANAAVAKTELAITLADTDATAWGQARATDADATEAKTALAITYADVGGLGNAAQTNSTDYATAGQGLLAESALQSGAVPINSTPYTVDLSDVALFCDDGAEIVSLPNIALFGSRPLCVIRRAATANVAMVAMVPQTVMNAANWVLSTVRESVILWPQGTDWSVV